eukprot:gene13941-15396_t
MKISIFAVGLFMAFMLVVKDSEAVLEGEDLVCSKLDCYFPQVCENEIKRSYCTPGSCPTGYACCHVGCGSYKCINLLCNEQRRDEFEEEESMY